MTDAIHVDANALGGLLMEVFGREMTDAHGCCASCGTVNPLGAMRVCWLSDASVALTYDVEAQRTGDPLYRAIMTSTYVQRGGQWLLMLHTQTPREST